MLFNDEKPKVWSSFDLKKQPPTRVISPMLSYQFKREPALDLTTLKIEGNRISLQSIDHRFSSVMFKEFTAEVTRYMFPKPAEAIEETNTFISESLEKMRLGQDLILVITKKDSEQFLGCCGFHLNQNPKTPELGIWIRKDEHGQKYGREAIHLLVYWAVENIDFDYAIYPVDKANIASRKIPESLGGIIFDERIVKSLSGYLLDEVLYKIPYETLKN